VRERVSFVIVGAASLVLALSVGVAHAVFGSLTFVEQQRDGVGGVDGLAGVFGVAASPDGANVYFAGITDDAVVTFARDPSTGRLAFVEQDKDGVGGVDGLDQAGRVAASPDGAHLYVTGALDDAVVTFSREPGSGALTWVEQEKDGVNTVDGLDSAAGVAVAPDGAHVYVAGLNDDAVVTFSRDPGTGALTWVEQDKDGVTPGVDGLDFATGVAVAPDGAHVYATGAVDDAVAVFSRDPSSGGLTFVEQQKDGVAGVDGLNTARGVTVSPDGAQVYVASSDDDAVAVFSRNASTGALTFVEQQKDGIGGVDGLDFAREVAASPDGAHVYATGQSDSAVATFSREPATGALTFVEQDKDGVDGADGFGGPAGLALSGDGAHVYVAGASEDAVAVFSREVPAAGDADPPETTITKGPKKKTKKRKAKFEFSSDEPGSTFLCKLDKKDFAPCDASEKFKVKRRKHKLQVSAIDPAGNTDPTPAKRKWKVKRKKKTK
jgi:6-phosphogluconolactonase (cycloisomerase 2 family)